MAVWIGEVCDNLECFFQGTDVTMLNKMNQAHAKCNKYIPSKNTHDMEFGICHFAGVVHYDSKGKQKKRDHTYTTVVDSLKHRSMINWILSRFFGRGGTIWSCMFFLQDSWRRTEMLLTQTSSSWLAHPPTSCCHSSLRRSSLPMWWRTLQATTGSFWHPRALYGFVAVVTIKDSDSHANSH